MYSFILAIHVFLALGITLLVLMQRSEGGALGGLGGNANATNFLTGRQAGDFLSKATGYLFAAFVITSLTLVIMAKAQLKAEKQSTGIIPIATQQPATPVSSEQQPVIPEIPEGE